MLNAIIRFSLRYRMLVVALSLTVMVYGSYLATTLPIDVFPDLDRPRVVIITECPGLATDEVETLVTQPIEVALLGATGVQAVRSQTTAGLNVIYIEFNWETEVRAARQTVQERLSTLAGVLPEGIRPQMTPTASIMGQIIIAGAYRQKGPNGGELAALEKKELLAELVERPSAAPQVHIWRPQDRRDHSTWQEIAVKSVRWEPAEDTVAGGGVAGERKALVTTEQGVEEVVFPSREEQHMALRTIADWVVRPRLL
ncbi:MAG: efflux RND transporter permease subunit, partial [Planctomycetales bacterium]|nr:efflux RND transporter permease subunit [Planctomycetales bacterium]